MDCFPGVSFTKTSKVQFCVNFAGPFKFDVNSLPNYRNSGREYISSVPNEILDLISAKAAISLTMAAQFRTVSNHVIFPYMVISNIMAGLSPHVGVVHEQCCVEEFRAQNVPEPEQRSQVQVVVQLLQGAQDYGQGF
jgi:hypothetical protein